MEEKLLKRVEKANSLRIRGIDLENEIVPTGPEKVSTATLPQFQAKVRDDLFAASSNVRVIIQNVSLSVLGDDDDQQQQEDQEVSLRFLYNADQFRDGDRDHVLQDIRCQFIGLLTDMMRPNVSTPDVHVSTTTQKRERDNKARGARSATKRRLVPNE